MDFRRSKEERKEEYLKVGESREGDSAESVADEVQEGSTEGDESSVSSQTVADGCFVELVPRA